MTAGNSYRYIAWGLIILSISWIAVKFIFWNYSFRNILPAVEYEVGYNFTMEGFDEPISLSTYLPVSDSRQVISKEIQNSGLFNLQITTDETGRKASWDNPNVRGSQAINYSFAFAAHPVQYLIDSTLRVPHTQIPGFEGYLEKTENIQTDHPFIINLFEEEVGASKGVLDILTSIHSYTNGLASRPFKGLTDAVTAAKLEEASCNGKSRLFIALARRANIPSRLVGGIILENGLKKTSHQWVETFVEGHWIPFDPLNNHFASLPGNYLSLYKGDEFILSHTPSINFDYSFAIKKRLAANPNFFTDLASHPFNAYSVWQAFERIGIPLGLLKIILLVPLGALIVALFRNVIGIKTFGIFLPALVAIASRETGLAWGLIAFVLIILVVSLVHFPLEKWGMLYTPKMAVMLVCVVMVFMTLSVIGINIGYSSLAYITLFPIVVVTITSEQFAVTIIEEGYLTAFKLTLQTLVVISVTYLAMNSRSMESFFLAFPELFLTIIGFNLLLGRWVGFRLTEYFRFKWIIQ